MCCRGLTCLTLALLTLATAASNAASVAISRSTLLSASGRTSDDSFELTDSFGALGAYDNTIGDEIVVAEGGTTRARATQQSTVTALLVGAATGSAEAQVAEFDAIAAQAETTFEFVFDVIDQAETLALAGSVASTFDAEARVRVTRAGGEDPIFERLVAFGNSDELTFDETLDLAPGRYTLFAEAVVTGTPAPNTADFDVSFDVSNPIPLPPAIWAGSVGLVVAWMYARRMDRRS
jgi:hypothetical protein